MVTMFTPTNRRRNRIRAEAWTPPPPNPHFRMLRWCCWICFEFEYYRVVMANQRDHTTHTRSARTYRQRYGREWAFIRFNGVNWNEASLDNHAWATLSEFNT
mmetsp:Transcript_654/g.1840  ORF Transcript_654/g.1840 Transcript_654/m.1840 type:complete len:102 (-) Transcript_654:44-349(-)